MPMGEYTDFADCVAQNASKSDPEAYCGALKHRTEDKAAWKQVSEGIEMVFAALTNKEKVGAVAGLLVKAGPPRPGLVPQSGDPNKPGRWVRPEQAEGGRAGSSQPQLARWERAEQRRREEFDSTHTPTESGDSRWENRERRRREEFDTQHSNTDLQSRRGQKAIKGIADLLVKAETCK